MKKIDEALAALDAEVAAVALPTPTVTEYVVTCDALLAPSGLIECGQPLDLKGITDEVLNSLLERGLIEPAK